MQSSSTFMWISGSFPGVKRYALINDYENIIVYSEESEQNGQARFPPNTSGRSEGQCHLRAIWLFLLSSRKHKIVI